MVPESNSISGLKNLLNCNNLPQNPAKYYGFFKNIAEILMNKCVISKRGVDYEIIEIEFYLYTSNHQDVITYPRVIDHGQWFFHISGVDLSFKSNESQFGGILIRGLRKMDDNSQIFGPQKCVEALWDKSDAFELNAEDYPIITERRQKSETTINVCPRHIPTYGKNPQDKINGWTARIPSNFKKDLSIEDKETLVFHSPYRFIKLDSIEKSDVKWKDYAGKPKKTDIAI